MTITPQAKALATLCADAYSTNRYNSWAAVAAGLLKIGLTEREAEAVMRSKWVRWAADFEGKPYGKATAKAVVDMVSKELASDPKAVRDLTSEYGAGELHSL